MLKTDCEIIILSSIHLKFSSLANCIFIVAKVLQMGVRYLVIEGIGLGLSGYGGKGLILDLHTVIISNELLFS